jgi:hypothetical protein
MGREHEKGIEVRPETELADQDLENVTGGRFYLWLKMWETPSSTTNGYHWTVRTT